MQKLYSLASDNSTAGGTICVAIAPEPLAMVPPPSCKRLANCPDEIRVGRMLGNFPQAFSHVGLINTAINLASVEGSAASEPAKEAQVMS